MDVPAGVTQEEDPLAKRIQPFLPLVDREVEFCVLGKRIHRSPLAGPFFCFLCCEEKSQFM